MPPFPYQRVSELQNQKNPRIPEMFFQMSEAEIVEALTALGYGERSAKAEAAQFTKYRSTLTSTQDFRDNKDEEPPPIPEEYRGFGGRVADMKRKE